METLFAKWHLHHQTIDGFLSLSEQPLASAAAAAATEDGRHSSAVELIQRIDRVNEPSSVVPNVIHYVWFDSGQPRDFSFINYISILSAHQIQKPDRILFHCNSVPDGKWWKRLWRRVTMEIVHRQPPKEIFGQPIRSVYHAGDVTKFELMITIGGIYLDADVIVVNSLDPLRVYNATLGKEKPPKLIAGIMLAAPGAEFFRLVYESYRNNYRGDDWDYNCARIPYQLYLNHSHLVHVETQKLTTPDFQDRHFLFSEIIDWRGLYVIHVMEHVLPPNTIRLKVIRTARSTLGEVIRFIYYGSPAVRTS